MKRLHIIQHVPFEGPGRIRLWGESHGYSVAIHPAYENRLPSVGFDDGICVMGGPMNIYEEDRYPWLREEKAWIREQIRADRPILGICLGAQLLADALGARVYRNPVKEIGWMPVQWTEAARRLVPGLPVEIAVLHWHGDTFDLPDGADLLATSAHCRNQAFAKGMTLGLQFHLEAGAEECARMIANCGREIVSESATIHGARSIEEGAAAHAGRAESLLFRLLDRHFRNSKI